jgi:hypothetical protein
MSLTRQKKRLLKEEGYVVIPNVLDPETVEERVSEIWDWLSLFSDGYIDRDDPETWKDEKLWPYTMGVKGIIQWYHCAHTNFSWNIRQDPRVVDCFARIWGTDELLTSFDGINIQRPPEITGKYASPFSENWQHIDQGKRKPGLHTVQGFVNLIDTGPDDGCLVVRPRSHLLHEEFLEVFDEDFDDKDWVKLDRKHLDWFDNSDRELPKGSENTEVGACETVRVEAPAGSLVLWDSRTVHTNSSAQPERDYKGLPPFRMVVYTCMTPREWATKAMIKKRIRYFEEGRVTNHYPHHVHVFPKRPYLYGNHTFDAGFERMESLFELPVLTPLGRSLVGY